MNIIGFSGKKQSGKNTAANIMAATILHSVGYGTSIDPKTGELLLADENGNMVKLDISNRKQEIHEWLEENIHPFVKIYSFADPLKEFCINTLGLTTEQCYGTDEQKNSKTTIKWNAFRKFLNKETYDAINKKNCWNKYMTAREILQVFGTDVMRSIYNDCWVNATINLIRKENSRCSIVADVRFPNEVVGIQKNNGKVIRLTRCPFNNEDLHSSELALDNYNGFDAILDNVDINVEEQGLAMANLLKNSGW